MEMIKLFVIDGIRINRLLLRQVRIKLREFIRRRFIDFFNEIIFKLFYLFIIFNEDFNDFFIMILIMILIMIFYYDFLL